MCDRHSICVAHLATISRLLQIIGLFCRISSLLQVSFAQETCDFKKPTNRSQVCHANRMSVTHMDALCHAFLECLVTFCVWSVYHTYRMSVTDMNASCHAFGCVVSVGSMKLYVSFAKEPCKRDDIRMSSDILCAECLPHMKNVRIECGQRVCPTYRMSVQNIYVCRYTYRMSSDIVWQTLHTQSSLACHTYRMSVTHVHMHVSCHTYERVV